MQLFEKYLDKILLLILFFTFISLVVFFTKHSTDMDNVHWARENAGTLVGAIVGLVTGYKIGQASAPPPPDAPKTK